MATGIAGFQGLLDAFMALNQLGATAAGYISNRRTDRALEQYGEALEEDALREGRAILGEQRAAFAKSGVDPGTGTPARVQRHQRAMNRLAAGRARYSPELQRFRLNQQNALDTGAGVSAALGMLGKGVLDYYQNRRRPMSMLDGDTSSMNYDPRRAGNWIA